MQKNRENFFGLFYVFFLGAPLVVYMDVMFFVVKQSNGCKLTTHITEKHVVIYFESSSKAVKPDGVNKLDLTYS